MQRKKCKYCGVEQDVTEFYASKRHSGGCLHKCKTCSQKYFNERYKNNPSHHKKITDAYHARHPDARKKARIKYQYGMTLDDYSRLLDKQNGKCAICHISMSELGRELDVDHDHTTGRVRGLLCNSCNIGLGKFRDNTQSLQQAINYLKNNDIC